MGFPSVSRYLKSCVTLSKGHYEIGHKSIFIHFHDRFKKGNLQARLCLSHIFTHFTGENIKDEITFRKYSKSPVNVLYRLKHGVHVFLAYFITREPNPPPH